MTRMYEDRHHSLTRILFPFLVILFHAGGSVGSPVRLLLEASITQAGNIRGRVVADIPDQRRILPGIVVTLSGERLGDRKIQSITDTEGQFDFQGRHTSFEGTDRSNPLRILRANGTTHQLIEFAGEGILAREQNEYSAFLQDKWIVDTRVVFDLGLRYDRDGIGKNNNLAPRLGFVLTPVDSDRTLVRGGIGLFYDKIPLNVGSFEQYQSLLVTTFAADGVTPIDGPGPLLNTAPEELENPYSLAWNLQLDHQLNPRLLLRLGYEERSTRRDFVIEPVEDALLLQNNGRSRYREFQAVARFRFQEGRNIFLSYVRSQARGNLNDFNTYFGNLKHALIRPDEYGKQPFDAPHRLLFWGDFGLPFDVLATPVVDWRSGFPFSLLNEDQEFVGPRNEGGRFPKLLSFDLLLTKGLTIPFRGKKYKGRAGFTVFNITNHWNPRDVQNNLDSRQFGTFFNSPDRSVRLKFEFVKY